MDRQHACIYCGDAALTYSDARQGFGAGKAIAGALVFGPLGLVAGAINKNKRHVHVRCENCLQTFTAEEMLAEKKAVARKARQQANLATAGTPQLVMTGMIVSPILAGISLALVDGGFWIRCAGTFVVLTTALFFGRSDAQRKVGGR